jgi:hypothetical protein
MLHDTIILSLENVHPMSAVIPSYTFSDLQVFVACSEDMNYEKTDFLFNGEQLIFPVLTSNCYVKIAYRHSAISFIQHIDAVYMQDYRYNSESWFFSCPNMQIETVEISMPDDIYFFSNLPAVVGEETYFLKTTNLPNLEISMIVLLKEFYENQSFPDTLNSLDVYFSKDVGMSADSMTLISVKKDSSFMAKCMHTIRNITTKLQTFTPNAHQHISIIDGALNMDGMAWGMTIPCVEKNKYLMLIDTSFWRDHSIIHEILHCYLPFQPQKDDSAFYFFSESMIEYLSVCLYQDVKFADAVFKQKMKKSRNKGYANISVLTLSDNRIDANTKKGSSVVIYDKTPAVIHRFAQKIGGNSHFLKILSLFYQHVQDEEKIDFKKLENIVKSQGVSNKQWQWFVKNL